MKTLERIETNSRMKKWCLTTFGGQKVDCSRKTPRAYIAGKVLYSRTYVLVPNEA